MHNLKSQTVSGDMGEICHSAHHPTPIQHQHRGVAKGSVVLQRPPRGRSGGCRRVATAEKCAARQ